MMPNGALVHIFGKIKSFFLDGKTKTLKMLKSKNRKCSFSLFRNLKYTTVCEMCDALKFPRQVIKFSREIILFSWLENFISKGGKNREALLWLGDLRILVAMWHCPWRLYGQNLFVWRLP